MKKYERTLEIIDLTTKCYELYQSSLTNMKQKNITKAKDEINLGDQLLLEASQIHRDLLSQNYELDLLLVHAEDMLISVQLYKSMMKELIDIYRHFPTLKGNQKSLTTK